MTLLTSCDHETIRATGEVTTKNYSFTDYTTLKVSDAFTVFVTFSDTEESVQIDANENLHQEIVVKQEQNSLIIRLKNSVTVKGNATLNAYIVTNSLSKFDISGATDVVLQNDWNTTSGEVILSGASEFEGEVSAQHLAIRLSGASDLDLFGATNSLSAKLTGSSTFKDYDLSIDDLTIDLSGASDAHLTINESIDITASGASVLNYKGTPSSITKNLSGASELHNKN